MIILIMWKLTKISLSFVFITLKSSTVPSLNTTLSIHLPNVSYFIVILLGPVVTILFFILSAMSVTTIFSTNSI